MGIKREKRRRKSRKGKKIEMKDDGQLAIFKEKVRRRNKIMREVTEEEDRSLRDEDRRRRRREREVEVDGA